MSCRQHGLARGLVDLGADAEPAFETGGGFSRSNGTRNSGLPVMPSEVVLITVMASSSRFPA
jgi:hypothetical protein